MATTKTRLENLIYLPQLFIRLVLSMKKQKQFLKETVSLDIENSKMDNDGTLTDKDYKKMTGYYGFAVPALLGEGFCLLRGKKMSKKERFGITYLGASTGLFDDFFDDHNISTEHILEMINSPHEEIAQNSNQKLFVKFWKVALENTENTAQLKNAAFKVYNAQVLSQKQQLKDTSAAEIEQITIAKGGLSILFYRAVFEGKINEDEQKMLNCLGGIGQLENDIFDIYKDRESGVRTLATISTKINHLRQSYTSLMEDTFSLVHQTHFAPKNKRRFLGFISIIICRGFVCLDFLEKNELQTNNVFTLSKYVQKDLICDMGSYSNTLKLFDYYSKTSVY